MALIDDLEGLLSPAEFAKIKGNTAVATRIAKGDELYGFYVGEETPAAVEPPARVEPPVRNTPAGMFDLGAIETMLDKRFSKLNETVDTRVNETIKARGDEFVNNAVKIAVQRADELNRIYARHADLTGKPFDSVDFNAFLEKPEIKAKGFRTLNDAYEAYASPVVQAKALADGIKEGVKAATSAQSGQHVPGTTPAPASNSNIRVFMNRGRAGDGVSPTTGAGRAAAALDAKMARDAAMAS
jgi:hypothetical protein